LLTTREQVDNFKAKHGVPTTPVIFIDGQQIDGTEDLAGYLEEASS
jgi:glutaredoxin